MGNFLGQLLYICKIKVVITKKNSFTIQDNMLLSKQQQQKKSLKIMSQNVYIWFNFTCSTWL